MIKSLNLRDDIHTLPIYFSQVREDPDLDIEVIEELKIPGRVLMIASGGDTLCSLATLKNVLSIDAVDANPSQIAISKFKKTLLKFSSENRLRILGHESMDSDIRQQIVNEICRELGIPNSSFGPKDLVSEEGIDFAGRYEQLFKGIQKDLKAKGLTLAGLHNYPEKLNEVFEEYFDLSLLIRIFGEDATQNPVKSFTAHFIERTQAFLRNSQNLNSPFLNQMLRGSFGPHSYKWMNLSALNDSDICPVKYHNEFMLDFLKNCPDSAYNFIHLSNILDWLSEDEASTLLVNAFRALGKGGRVIIRQLNSTLDIKEIGKAFNWDLEKSEELTEKDKSFFYRKILVGEKV